MMKKLIKYFVIIAFSAATSYGYYTHSEIYLGTYYDNLVKEECLKIDSVPFCLIGAAIIKEPVVKCMQYHLFSTSEKTVRECFEKVLSRSKDKAEQ